MKEFAYKARNNSGKRISGIIEASAVDEATKDLKKRGYLLVSIKEAKNRFLFSKGFSNKISFSEINIFSRQLSCLVKAGMPFLPSLIILKEQENNRQFKNVISGIMEEIERGSFFSVALSKYEGIFGKFYIEMIRISEVSGTLGETLERLTVVRERDQEIKSVIKAATIYPIIVIFVMIIGFFVLTIFVLPRFMGIFSRFKGSLPLPTRVLIYLNHFLNNFWHIILFSIVGLIMGVKSLIKTPKGRLSWDTAKLKIPVIGPLNLKMALSRFVRAMSILTRTGVPIVEGLELAKENLVNSMLKNKITVISSKVIQGESLSAAMKEEKIFPLLVTQMVAAGENTGKLDELLLFVSDYYDTQVKYALKNLIVCIEPALIIVLGVSVLFMALAVFLPMWNMIQLFKR